MDGRADTTDRITCLANTVGNYWLRVHYVLHQQSFSHDVEIVDEQT